MAKTTKCACCGKEITKSTLFSEGESKVLEFTTYDGIFAAKNVACCEECFEKYASNFEMCGKRFTTKVLNAYSSAKGIDEATVYR